MSRQPRDLVNIFPAEQQVILLEHGLNMLRREGLADGATVLVEHHAARLVQHLPSALPGHEAEVRVLQIERLQQRIESAQLQKLAPIERTASAAAVEAREK